MNRVVEFINLSFQNSSEYFKQSIKIQHIKAHLVSTFSSKQKAMFEDLLNNMNKLHKLDIEEHIIHTHNVCKEAFKLR